MTDMDIEVLKDRFRAYPNVYDSADMIKAPQWLKTCTSDDSITHDYFDASRFNADMKTEKDIEELHQYVTDLKTKVNALEIQCTEATARYSVLEDKFQQMEKLLRQLIDETELDSIIIK